MTKPMKNDQKLKMSGLTPHYYRDEVFRGGTGAQRMTVCLLSRLRDGKVEVVARGISLCSKQDTFVKKTGRNIALGRAISAFEWGENRFGVLSRTALIELATYLPILWPIEGKIIASYERMLDRKEGKEVNS